VSTWGRPKTWSSRAGFHGHPGQANGATLLAIAVLIVYEAIRRLLQPPTVNGRLVLVVALAGIVVNLFATWQLSRAERKSLNIQGSFQHILTDLYAFIATAVAALVIIATGYTRADPLVSFLIAALMLRAPYGLLRDAGRVLMEVAPAGMSAAEVGDCLARHPQVVNVHDFHPSGRSPRACPRCRLTSWSGRAQTAMPSAGSSSSCSTSATRSNTPRCRSTTLAKADPSRSGGWARKSAPNAAQIRADPLHPAAVGDPQSPAVLDR
jgi:hypothetical protein